MSKHRLFLAASVVLAVLAFPRLGSAGIGELIIEMSGPQMYGFLADCRIAISGTFEQCKAVSVPFAGPGISSATRVWLSFEGGFYISTAAKGFGHGNVRMLAFDPMLEIQTISKPRFAMYHGVMGASFNYLAVGENTAGVNVPNFANAAFKLRPIGVVFPVGGRWRLEVEYNFRLYPNRFRPEQFGKAPDPAQKTTSEVVHGIVVGLRF